MGTKRQKVIERLKKQGRKHYYASQANNDMSCGGALGDHIRSNNTEGHYAAYQNIVARLRRVDPTCPR